MYFLKTSSHKIQLKKTKTTNKQTQNKPTKPALQEKIRKKIHGQDWIIIYLDLTGSF